MSDTPDPQSLSVAEQLAQIDDKLKQVKEFLEEPDFTQETFNKVADLSSQIRATIIEVMFDDNATAYYRQSHNKLLESNRLIDIATKKLRDYAKAIQKQQRQKK